MGEAGADADGVGCEGAFEFCYGECFEVGFGPDEADVVEVMCIG